MNSSFSISVLISGGGTTLKNLIEKKGQGSLNVEIKQVISNNPKAGGLAFADNAGIDAEIISHKQFDSTEEFSEAVFASIRNADTDLVVMGGFLRRLVIPTDFTNRVVNIHPSLIPSFCGKGNYGRRVHQAVIDYGCKVSGCTVHFVDDQYDHGPIIAQRTVQVMPTDTAETLAARVFEVECDLYPDAINRLASGNVELSGRTVVISE